MNRIGALLAVVAATAVAGCSSDVGITMELSYSPDACGGCAATEAELPAGASLGLAIADADSFEVLESRCFSLNQAVTIAGLPEVLRGSEFNQISLPGDRSMAAAFAAYPPGASCDDLTGTALIEAVSDPILPEGGATTFLLVLRCPTTQICEP